MVGIELRFGNTDLGALGSRVNASGKGKGREGKGKGTVSVDPRAKGPTGFSVIP